jgi:hypothetical protein
MNAVPRLGFQAVNLLPLPLAIIAHSLAKGKRFSRVEKRASSLQGCAAERAFCSLKI